MCALHLPKHVSRRDVLRATLATAGIAALGPFGRGLLPVAEGAPLPGHRRVVSIFCYGGYDGLNLLVPTGNQAYYDRRPGLAIDPAVALDIGETGYALHPAFARVGAMYADGDVAVFRKVGYPDENQSHFISQDVHSWGVRGEFAPLGIPQSGWVARYADAYATTPMGAAALGVGRPLEFEGGSTNPFLAASLASFNFDRGGLSTGEHAHRLETIQGIVAGYGGTGLPSEARTALEQGHQLTDQIQAAVAAYVDPTTGSPFSGLYPTSVPGRYLRDTAILIRGGFETEVFMTGFGGWDTHGNQGQETGTQATLIGRLDAALGVFADECKALGIWDDVLILISSEFGRRNYVNGSGGTDHGHGNNFFALGGGVNGGLYGPDISESDVADRNWLDYGLDYRDVFKEAVANHLGGSAAVVFPEPQDVNTTLNYV